MLTLISYGTIATMSVRFCWPPSVDRPVISKIVPFLLALAALAGCSSASDRAAAADARHDAAAAAGDLAAARNAAAEAVRARDDVTELWLKLGRAEAALGRLGPAYAAYQRASELDQGSAEALQALADLSVAGGDLDEALRYAEKLNLLSPDDPRATIVRGVVALRRRQPAVALEAADRVLAQYPGTEAAVVLRARAQQAIGQLPQAADGLENDIRVRGPTEGKVRPLIEILRAMGDQGRLQQAHARLIQLVPDDTEARLDQARDLYRAAAVAGRHQAVGNLLRTHPNDQQLPARIVAVWRSSFSGAVPDTDLLRFAAGASPASSLAFARYALDTGRPELTARLLTSVTGTGVTAGNATARALLGAALFRLGRRAEGLQMAERVLDFDSAHPDALRVRAEAALARGDGARALHDAQLLVRDQPSDPRNRLLLARAQVTDGSVVLAELTLREAVKEFPNDAAVAAEHAKLRAAARSGRS